MLLSVALAVAGLWLLWPRSHPKGEVMSSEWMKDHVYREGANQP